MTSLTSLLTTFQGCSNLKTITLPSTLNSVTTFGSSFNGCFTLTSVTLPTSMTSCTNFVSVFQNNYQLRSVTLPTSISINATNFSSLFSGCYSLNSVSFPSSQQLINLNTISGMFLNCSNLTTITNFNFLGALNNFASLNADANTQARLTSISFSAFLSKLNISGSVNTNRADVQSVRLLNATSGQWSGTSPQINVSNTNMSTANLVQLFNDMAAQGNVVSKTINITTAIGTAGLTAADRLIITSKGWTITG
jgi:hypothetical protein